MTEQETADLVGKVIEKQESIRLEAQKVQLEIAKKQEAVTQSFREMVDGWSHYWDAHDQRARAFMDAQKISCQECRQEQRAVAAKVEQVVDLRKNQLNWARTVWVPIILALISVVAVFLDARNARGKLVENQSAIIGMMQRLQKEVGEVAHE